VLLSIGLKNEKTAREDLENKLKQIETQQASPTYRERKCASFELENANLSDNQIVFIGDSITDLFPLDNYFADLDLATYNRGIIGDSTAGVIDRLQISAIDINPSKIVLLIGVNDVISGREPSTIIEKYLQLLTKIKTSLPLTQVYCISILPVNSTMNENFNVLDASTATERIKSINPQIKAYCDTEPNMEYIDVFSLMATASDTLVEDYTYDGLHLTTAGYQVWASAIKPYL
jgi:lysophospholipase L1-like esterase